MQFRRLILPLLILMLCAVMPAVASPVKALRAAWVGNDFIITLSDSTAFTVNDEDSDTSRLVLDISGITLDSAALSPAAMPGANSRTASLTASRNGAQLVVVSTGQLGWAVLWRPYTHQIVVHTFSHAHVSYAEEQYYLGLLALEQIEDSTQADAEDLLSKAYATGENRAASVLGAYYARNGQDSLALKYLSAPMSADDYGALAEVQRRMGDTEAAAKSEKKFQELFGQLNSTPAADAPANNGSTTSNASPAEPSHSGSFIDKFRHSLSDWRIVAALCLVGIALLLGIGWMMMRRSAEKARRLAEARRAASGTPQQQRPDPNVTRVTAVEERSPVETVRVVKPDKPAAVPPAPPVVTTPPPVVPPPVVAPATAQQEKILPAEIAPATESPAVVQPPAPVPETTDAAVVQAKPEAAVPEPVKEVPPVPAPTTTPEARPHPRQGVAQRIPAQAAELRRRLEAMRAAETGEQSEQPVAGQQATPAPDAPQEPLVDTARRMNVSRDHIELRKKLSDMLRDKKSED